MVTGLNFGKILYILSNLLVLPAIFIPYIDLLSNLSFLFAFLSLAKINLLLALALSLVFVLKNNSNYRFNLLLKSKGDEISKSDYECVYLYAWCTLLRYFLILMALNQLFLLIQ
tara:strand:- start:987 stop:1328 length:342 start_codon:yes stop_codon:yes gene_type:complete